MKQDVLRHRDFWHLASGAAQNPGHATKVLADYLDDHDSPIRADLLRRGGPVFGEDARHIVLPDESPAVRTLGHDADSALYVLAHHIEGPESYELFHALPEHLHEPIRHVIRYTLRLPGGGHLRTATAVSREQLHAIADQVPNDPGFNWFRHFANHMPEEHATALARMQAPTGGAIVNQTFQKGGQFMAKAFKSIRATAARLAKLARMPESQDYNALLDGVRRGRVEYRDRPQDGRTENDQPDTTPSKVFADWLEENGIPGAHAVRMRAETQMTPGQINTHQRSIGTRRVQTSHITLSDTPESLPPAYAAAVEARNNLRAEATRERGVAATAAITTGRGGSGLILHVQHVSGSNQVVHAVPIMTAAELLHAVSDFPPAAREALLRPLIDNGTLKRVLKGRGKGNIKLGRSPKLKVEKPETPIDVDTSLENVSGAGDAHDTPLTHGDIMMLEDRANLPMQHRVSRKFKAGTDLSTPVKLNIAQATALLGHMTRAQMPDKKLRATLKDPKVNTEAKRIHLTTNLLKDLTTSPHGSWYGDDVTALDTALHHTFAKSPEDPFWGTTSESGEHKGKHAPDQHHPALVLFKALLGSTSVQQNPNDNLNSAVGMWKAGEAAAKAVGSDDPIAHIPPRRTDALHDGLRAAREWHEKALGRPLTSEEETSLHSPGKDHDANAKWWSKWIAPMPEAAPFYASRAGRVLQHEDTNHEHHGVWTRYQPSSGSPVRNPGAPKATDAKEVDADLPLTDTDGLLRPKGWAYRAAKAEHDLKVLQAIIKHHKRGGRSTLQAYRDAAGFLFNPQTPEALDAMSKATKGATKPHAEIFKEGYHRKGEAIPGFFTLGPKIGAFVSNLHANDPSTHTSHGKYFTFDTWQYRQLLRHLGALTGKPVDAPSPEERALIRDVFDDLSARVGAMHHEIQARLWTKEQGGYRRFGVGTPSFSYKDAAKKFLLMRAGDETTHDALLRTASTDHEPTALGVLGDFLQEQGMPGAELAREGHRQGQGAYRAGQLGQHHHPAYDRFAGWWVGEHGLADPDSFYPHTTEVVPMPAADPHTGIVLLVRHGGTDAYQDHAYHQVHIPDAKAFKRLTADLPEAMRKELTRQIKRMKAKKMTRLSRPAFEKAIKTEPLDATTHRVFADWLDENGHEHEAAFHRSMGDWLDTNRDNIKDLERHYGSSGWAAGGPLGYPDGVVPDNLDFPRVAQSHILNIPDYAETSEPYHPVGHTSTQTHYALRWNTFAGMQEAFKRAFMKGRGVPPVKLARPARVITYVGGAALPGAQRAVGIWPEGAEPSNVVTVESDAQAEQIARANQQHSAIWFRPGAGEDSLHVFTLPEGPAAVARELQKHGVSYATLVPKGDSTTVHVVDQGSQFVGVLPGKSVKGTATFRELDPVPVKLARPIQVIKPGETAHAALTRILDARGRDEVHHGRTARIYRVPTGEPDADTPVHVDLHGSRIVTTHPNGQVTFDHHGHMTPTTRRFMSGFSGHNVSFAGGKMRINGEEHENGTPYPKAQGPAQTQYVTIPHTDPELRNWWKTLQSHIDARVMGDWLEEHGDWRHHIARNAAIHNGSNAYTRHDGVEVQAHDTPLPIVYHEAIGSPGSRSHILHTDSGHIVLDSMLDRGTGHTLLHSVHTPEEYEQMRKDAATAGVHFPEINA